ncbi:MAG: hypothetical protein DRP02_04005 [Candidatus Gerdarchaeota archaeon]|nr:MAG: hypothetical protein DRP02_04005 [Candidatus Gerdarchaeota archaeon]
MAIESENEKIVKEFLRAVENKLPFWLRNNKKEVEEILEELQNHIWDKATEIAGKREVTEKELTQAIQQMGEPEEIAKEYKRRGKPKVYVTEELFPLYTRVLIITLVAQFFLNVIGAFFNIGTGVAGRRFFSGLTISATITIILITLLFVYLSLEGYYPEDLQTLSSRLPTLFQKKQTSTEKTSTDKAKRELTSIEEEPKVKILSESSTNVKPVSRVEKQPTIPQSNEIKEKPKRVVRYREYSGKQTISNGIFELFVGIAMMILVFLPVFEFISQPTYYPLNWWLFAYGGTIVTTGIIKILKSIIGRIVRPQQGLMFLKVFPIAVKIPLLLVLLQSVLGFGPYTTQVLNVFELLVEKLNVLFDFNWTFDPNIGLTVLKVIVYFHIVVNSLKIFSEFIGILRLEFQGFPIREKEIIEYR